MKKRIALALALVMLLAALAGCTTTSSKSYTYNVDNGDKIKIELDTTDDYNISAELPFAVSCNGETLSQGSFMQAFGYDQYVTGIEQDENAVLLDSGTKDGNQYIFWNYNNEEFNYAVLIKDSKTGVLIGNNVSEESAKECFNRLTISTAE